MNALDIIELRKKLSLTQEMLAEKIGVSRNTIINYEKGGRIPDSKSTILNKIANENAQNNTILNEESTVYETGFDKKIAEHEEKISSLRNEIIDWEEKIRNNPSKKETYTKYIDSLHEQIFLLNEIINITLESKKEYLEENNK